MQNAELFPKDELDGIIAAEAALRTINATLIAQAAAVDKLRPALSGMTKPFKEMVNGEQMLAAIEKEVAKAQADTLKIYAQLSPALRTANQERANARVQLAANNRELKLEAQEANATANSLNALTTRLSQLKIAAKNLDLDTPEFKQAAADINELNTKILTAEQSMGVFGRNVGNYASGFSPLNFQVQQLARELPSLANSLPQFFLAISNNLPMFTDEIAKAKTAYDAYKKSIADGVDAPKVVSPIKQIISSIFSWQTAIVLGITVLSMYGKEIVSWVGSLLKGGDAALDMSEAMGKVNKAMEFESLGKQIGEFERLAQAYRDVGDSAEEKKKFLVDYREELENAGITVRDVSAADRIFIEQSEDYIRALMLRAKATAAANLAAKEFEKGIEAQIKLQPKIDSFNTLLSQLESQRAAGVTQVSTGTIQTSTGGTMQTFESIDVQIERTRNSIKKWTDEIESEFGDGSVFTKLNLQLSEEADTIIDSLIPATNSLIDAQQKLRAEAELMPETTEAEILAKNKRIKQIEDEISRLQQLGVEQGKTGSGVSVGSDSSTPSRGRMSALNAERKAIEELTTAEIDARMGAIERTLDADQTATAERVTLTNELYDLEEQRIKQLADVQRANLIQRNIDENTTYNKDGSVASTIDEGTAAGNVKNQLLLLQIATDQAMIESVNDRIKEIQALEDRAIEDNIRAFTMQMNERMRIMDQYESNELEALSAQYSGVFSNQQKYEDERIAITRKYADLREAAGLEALETQLSELKKDGNITIAEQQKIADLEAQISDYKVEMNHNANERMIEDDEIARDRRIQMLSDIADAANEIFSAIVEISGMSIQKQLDDLDKQAEDNEKAAEEEQERIERLAEAGAITEEQKNARIALSEQELAAKQAVIDAQRSQLEKRQARYEILLSTARAIMSAALTQPFIPLGLIAVGTATALGVAQLAAVNAAQYAKGTPKGGHPGGLAWVGDGGRSEAVIYGGKMYQTPAVPTLIDLPKGADVLPDWNDVIKNGLAHDLITEAPGGVNNYYDVPAAATYNDKGVRLRLDKQIDQTERLIREIRRGRKADRITEFKNRKLTGIN